jgi:rhodanese-related sulfurtransferase
MAPNPDFLRVFEDSFPRDASLILGCQTGVRSLHAAQILQAQGFSDVVDQRAGYAGAPPDPGWRALGLPVATQAAEGRAYPALAAAAARR